MDIKQTNLLDLLSKPNVQFRVPIFQRVYSWTERQAKELFDDILNSAKNNTNHFVGNFIYTLEPNSLNNLTRYSVVDGQQRLTTITIILLALSYYFEQNGSVDLSNQIRENYLLNNNGACKLMLTHLDRDTLAALVYKDVLPEDYSVRVKEIFDLYLGKFNNMNTAELVFNGLKNLEVIAIALTSEDNPQAVFESLNAKGMRLALGDMVKNLVLSDAQSDNLNTQYWQKFEEQIASITTKKLDISDLIVCWLTQTHDSVPITGEQEVYNIFKDYLREKYNNSLEAVFKELQVYCVKFVEDAVFRQDALDKANLWTTYRPNGLREGQKIFGS
ncbi:MAG: DUF262 domain-containing protein [Coriobacteriales bacterium]|nr:DUF262 domain-containing protein [Coriobacteriales bacterium]